MRTATGLAALLLASATAVAPGRGGRATRSPAFRASRAAPSFSARDGASPADGASGASDDLHASLRERWCELMLEKMVIAHSLPELELGLVDSSADELDGAFGGSWRAAASRCRRATSFEAISGGSFARRAFDESGAETLSVVVLDDEHLELHGGR